MLRIAQGLDAFQNPLIAGLEQADTIYAVVLAANVSQQIALPAGANMVLFAVTSGADFYMKFTGTAISVPASDITDGSAPEMNPLLRSCAGKTHVSLVSGAACTVTMAFYA